MERFAASTGAGVDDALAGLGIDERGDHLRAGVLDFHATVEAKGLGQGFAGGQHEGVGQAGDFGGGDVETGEPGDDFRAGGAEGVDAEENGGALIQGCEFGVPGVAEFGRTEGVEPVGDGFADGAGLVDELGFAGFHFLGGFAVVGPPFRDFVAHADPLGGAEGGGFLAVDEEGKRAPPAGDLEDGLGDETAVALAPFRVFLEGGGEFVIEDAMLAEDGLGDVGSGLGEDAVHFHKGRTVP